MIITSIRLVNYRCFVDSDEIPFQKFSILIGKNDGGKSSLLYALKTVLDSKAGFVPQDHWLDPEKNEDQRAQQVEVYVRFFDTRDGTSYHIRASHQLGEPTRHEIEAECVGDPQLDQDLDGLNLQTLKLLCTHYELNPEGAQSRRDTFLKALIDHKSEMQTH